MSKPVRFRNKWRIRWFDEYGKRQSAVFEKHADAAFELAKRESEVQEIRRGLRMRRPEDRTFDELFDYWLRNRAPLKRSGGDDASIIARHLRPAFGRLRLLEITAEHTDPYVLERQESQDRAEPSHAAQDNAQHGQGRAPLDSRAKDPNAEGPARRRRVSVPPHRR